MNKKIVALIFVIIFTSFSDNVDAKSDTTVDAKSDITIDAKSDITVDDVYKIIRDNLLKHKETFTIDMNSDTYSQLSNGDDVILMATDIDQKDTSKDGDYLLYSLSSWGRRWKFTWGGGYLESASLTVDVVYSSTLKQEKKVDTKIKSVLDSLKLEGKSDYSKVKAIHDYIIKRVSYDFTYEKYSAYNALIEKSSVCRGYVSLAYRMFTDAGIECRIIGTLDHAWNIVKVNGKWYNIDLTWDDPNRSKGPQVIYDYFLKNAASFRDHTGYKEIMTKEFTAKYPIAKDSYKLEK
ncbi:MAG: Transglutaminase-like superfamily [Herbinix sp.]|nr:Transglutaminase-like superfamily [Herbinix sp.]